MAGLSDSQPFPMPTIVVLGDRAVLVRFGSNLTDAANRAAIGLAAFLDSDPIAGILEVVPSLISVMFRYDPGVTFPSAIAGELRLRLIRLTCDPAPPRSWTVPISFDGPDLAEVASALGLSPIEFAAAHNASPLRVLTTGFAPGFVYCGMHGDTLSLPRRTKVRPSVPAGSVLFAAGQTAITSTEMPTGWHVIGHTDFSNFDPHAEPPTQLRAGDAVRFEQVG